MSRMSLARTGSQDYRNYLRSRAWNWRRRRWFRDVRAAGREPACQVCGLRLEDTDSLDLHHVSYAGVGKVDGRWAATEADEDLLPLCRADHQAVHRMLDRSKDFYGWDRRRATVVIIAHLVREREERSRR